MHTARRSVLLLAALAIVAGVTGVVLLAASADVAVGPNVVVTDGGPAGLIEAHNSPGIVRNPTDADNLVVVHRVDRPMFDGVLHASVDGGSSWQATELPLPDGLDRAFAPDAAFGPDGTLYVNYVNLAGQGNVPDNLWLARSEDGGRTLGEPVRVAGELSFQARVAVDGDGRVHLTYLEATDVALLQLVGPAPLVAVHSTDGGRTWTEPVTVSDPERVRVGAATPAIDAAGDLVVLYQDFKGNVRDFQNLEGPPWPEPAALVLTRSRDGGRSFAPGVELESDVVVAKRFLVFLPEFPALALGSGDDVYVAWSDGRHGEEDVFLRRSTDGGQTWRPAVRISDAPGSDDTAQYLPAASVAPGGRVDVLYYDRSGEGTMDAVLAYSVDDGESFDRVRVSSTSFDPEVGPVTAEHLDVDFGSRLGLVSGESAATAVWTDSRLAADPDHGRQDIWSAAVTLPATGASSRRVTAGVLLLVAVGCLAAAGLLRRRARRASSDGAAESDRRARRSSASRR